ncbi:MAG: tryptophan synthase subunit alpha [Actinobacteria bacterium]|nr:tryptophan synthase subunit alpha [Actinomycetota bacterium]
MSCLEARLRERRDLGAKLLVCYLTAGASPDWLEVARAVVQAGADAIEIGIPFSDPMMDGPVIQEASRRALLAGFTPLSVIAELSSADLGIPVVVMSYYNIFFKAGLERMADQLGQAGIEGAIIPDLPIDEAGNWRQVASQAGIETVFLVAPPTPVSRMTEIARASQGFVYCVGLMGVTGERLGTGARGMDVAARVKAVTDTPALVGIGVSSPEQVVEVAGVADGAVVGSALVRRVLDGEGPTGVGRFVAELRSALDAMQPAGA